MPDGLCLPARQIIDAMIQVVPHASLTLTVEAPPPIDCTPVA